MPPQKKLRYIVKKAREQLYLRDTEDHPVWSSDLQDAGWWRPDTIADVVRNIDTAPIEILLCSISRQTHWVKQPDPENYRYARKDGTLYQPANVFIQQEAELVVEIIHND